MIERICPGCDQPFEPKRSNQKYHDKSCKQAAYRRRVDPLVGTAERKEAKLDGLYLSGKSGERKEIIATLAWRGLLPRKLRGGSDPERARPLDDHYVPEQEQERDRTDLDATKRRRAASPWHPGLRARINRGSGGSRPPSWTGRHGATGPRYSERQKRAALNEKRVRKVQGVTDTLRGYVEASIVARFHLRRSRESNPLGALMTGQQVREPLKLLLVAWPSVFDRIAERRNAKSRLRLIVELERAYQRLQKEINEVLDKQILQEVARLAEASDAIGVALDESQKQRHEIQARTVTLQRLLRARYGNDWLESAREHLGDQVFAGSAR